MERFLYSQRWSSAGTVFCLDGGACCLSSLAAGSPVCGFLLLGFAFVLYSTAVVVMVQIETEGEAG